MDINFVIVILFVVSGLAVVAFAIKNSQSAAIGGSKYHLKAGIPSGSDESKGLPQLSDLELEGQARSLVDRHKSIEAIAIIHKHRNIGLKDAKDLVDEYERSGQLNLPKNGIQSEIDRYITSKSSTSVHEPGLERVLTLLREGQKIMALKELRDQTGLGLSEAKAQIDKLEREL